jgi:hypothetical protein
MLGRALLAAFLVMLATSSGATAAARSTSGPLTGPPCAGLTTQTLVATDGMVAERIYRGELTGPATVSDSHQVESYQPLLKALADNNGTAIHTAVVSLVYSHTHIVRLRVSRGGSLLADVGGPYIIAPVGGSLYYHGRLVGTYLLSVQDDLGFVGLETRLIGTPVVLYVRHSRVPLKGTVRPGSAKIPDRGTFVIHRRAFQAYSFNAKAYPTGVLRISLLHPGVRPSGRSCTAVKVAEIGRITRSIWRRFKIDNSPITGFVTFAQSHTGALTYVRAGTKRIDGSAQPGPAAIPSTGVVKYRGASFAATSFAANTAAGEVRVYALVAL